MMTSDHGKEAAKLFEEGYNCSQSVFLAYTKESGLDPVIARKIATGFGGGVGRTGNMCGAVSGAILAIGLLHGMTNPDEPDGREKNYSLVKEFIQKFTDRFGSIQCPALVGYNFAIPEEMEEAKKQGITRKVCPQFVAGAVEILDEIL